MTTPLATEKFASSDLSDLQASLKQASIDSFQAAELISAFLTGRGYGISAGDIRPAVMQMDLHHCSLQKMRQSLEGLALEV